ncbi:Tuberous sclerosis 2-like protein, partial [Kluyveromyces marxianus]
SPYWPQFWEQLKLIIEDPNTPFLNLRGAVSILTDLAQQDKEDWLIWLTKIFKRGTSMYGQILESIKTLINDDHFNNNNTENHGYIWFNEENMCLLKMLRIVLDIDAIKQNNPLTIASIYDKLLDGLISGKYGIYGFKDSVSFLSFIMEHKDVLSEDQLLELTKYFDSCDVPLSMNVLSQVISILDPSKDFSTNIIRYITRIYKSLESAQLDSENIVIINSILSLLTTEESRPVFASCVEFLVAISGSLPPETLLEYVEAYLVPKEPRRRSIVSIGIEHVKNKWKAEEQ